MLLKTKLTNQLKEEAKNKDMEIEIFLNNITVNGSKKGCSGHVVFKTTGSCVYINTEGSCYGPLSGKVMYRLAKDIKDYSSNSIRNGNNRWTEEQNIATEVLELLMKDKGYVAGESYREMKRRHQQEVNSFPIYFAFGKEQIKARFAELGLDAEQDLDKIAVVPGTGGFMLKKHEGAFYEMLNRHRRERENAIAADKEGTGFIYQMFRASLNEHEFGYTGDADDSIRSLGYTEEEIEANSALKNGFEKAKEDILWAS